MDSIQALLDHERSSPRPEWAGSAAAAAADAIERAIGGHIMYLAAQGKLPVIPHAAGRSMPYVSLWNALAKGEDTSGLHMGLYEEPTRMADALGKRFYKVVSNLTFGTEKPEVTAASLHADLVSRVEQGTFGNFEASEHYCFITGARHGLVFDHWSPQLTAMGKDYRFRPIQDDGPGEILDHLVLPVPSGHLLVSDWIRVEGFSELTKAVEDEEKEDINCLMGRIARTKAYEPLGVASVCVGNSSPHIYQYADRLIVGTALGDEGDLEGPTGRDLGYVTTDFRWVTMVDRQVLEDMLAQKMGADVAKAKVAEYIEKDSELRQVHVKPGDHHLYFAGDPYVFGAKFAAEGVSTAGFEVPRFVLSERLLTLVEKPALEVECEPSAEPRARRPRLG